MNFNLKNVGNSASPATNHKIWQAHCRNVEFIQHSITERVREGWALKYIDEVY